MNLESPTDYRNLFTNILDEDFDEDLTKEMEAILEVNPTIPAGYPGKLEKNKEIKKLEHEIDVEEKSLDRSKLIDRAIIQVQLQSEFLEGLNKLAELREDSIEVKYLDLKQQYAQELAQIKKFYESYYKLAVRYKELKGKQRQLTPVKEKVKLIRSTTTQKSIKNLCEEVLNSI